MFVLPRMEPLGVIVGQIKTGSLGWLQKQLPELQNFHWQNGYGAFYVIQSTVKEVREYIRTQQEHHRLVSFQEEFRRFLQRYEAEYDEKYVWD